MNVLVSIRAKVDTLKMTNGQALAQDTVSGTSDHRSMNGPESYYNTAEEQRIKRQEQVNATLSGEIVMLIYDIPVVKNAQCPNPSHILWWYGFRLNDSCWVLPEKGINSPAVQELLTHWKQHNISTYVIPYAEKALSQIRAIASEKLRQEIIRAHTSLIQRIGSANERLETARKEMEQKEKEGQEVTEKDREKADSYRDNTVRSIIKAAGESLNASVSCAQMFDETESVESLLEGLRQAIRSEAEAFNAQMKLKNSKPVKVSA